MICFYSLTIGFMLISNIKCRFTLSRKSTGVCCFEIKAQDPSSYDIDPDETKHTIHMIFNDSSKLLTSVVLPPSLISKYNAAAAATAVSSPSSSSPSNHQSPALSDESSQHLNNVNSLLDNTEHVLEQHIV